MIEGIEILSQEVCIEFQIALFFACAILFMFIGLAFDLIKDISDGSAGAILGLALGMFMYFIIFHVIVPDEYTAYKVTISESVSMTEFYEQYEIIDVDGKIYTIREMDDDEP